MDTDKPQPKLLNLTPTATLECYRKAVEVLEKFKAKHFYHGTKVWVNDARYHGPGIAVTDGTCWPDHVAVALPNGNTWRYRIEAVHPAAWLSVEG